MSSVDVYGISEDESALLEMLPNMMTGSASGGGHPPAVAFVPRERERERSPLLASSSRMQSVASTITTGTGLRMDPDTESLVIT